MDILNMTHHFWHHFEHYIRKYPGLGGIFGAVFTGLILVLIAVLYTTRLSRINATLDFSKRFHDLLEQQHKLNTDFTKARAGATRLTPATAEERSDAEAWWWRFFDLLLYEFEFRRHWQIDKKRFHEWMTWRYYDFKGWDGYVWKTCGVSYAEGWCKWKSYPPNKKNPLVVFLDDVHNAPDPEAADRVVRAYSTAVGRSCLVLCKRLFGPNTYV